MYELIIIGAGPAGITAGVYAARQKINTLIITKDIGGQTAWSGNIENYTGYQFITGPELTKKFEEHLTQFDIELKTPEEVTAVNKEGDVISVKTKRDLFRSQALIIASGKSPRFLNVPGEKEFKNKGVTYCAVCDGPLFSGKDVAVVGGGNSALDAALQMSKIARKVYLINLNPHLAGEPTLKEKVEGAKNTEVINNAVTKEIVGDAFVKEIKVEVNGQPRVIQVGGVFVEIGLIPAADFIQIVEKNQWGEIKVDARCATNIPGIFAAGDVTAVPEKQIIIAAGEGSKAALGVARYLVEGK
ncbi:MAG: FAD-dependent oxidoreductase [Candidatus Omnitrophota bacterium]|jgi:alkyl hydroperoxide reductase subunit F